MTQILNLNVSRPLTADERQQLQTYAESLVARQESSGPPRQPDLDQTSRINVDALVGLCKGMGGDKSDKELIREAWDEIAKKYD